MLARMTYKSAVKNICWEAETNFAATPQMLQNMRFMFDSSDYYKYTLQVQKVHQGSTMAWAIGKSILEAAHEGEDAGVTDERLHLFAVIWVSAARIDGVDLGTDPGLALAVAYREFGLHYDHLLETNEAKKAKKAAAEERRIAEDGGS